MLRFTERQAFSAVVYAVMGLALGVSVYAAEVTYRKLGLAAIWPAALVSLTLNLLCLKTRVTDRELVVSFGAVLPFYRRHFALPNITAAEAVTYSPLADYGGWGIRGWGRNTALNARGNQGVRMLLSDGSHILVGSQRPSDLVQALGAR